MADHLPDTESLLPTAAAYRKRLLRVLDPNITGDARMCSPLAACAVMVMRYVGSLSADRPVRPSTVLWASEDLLAHTTDEARDGYYSAASVSKKRVAAHAEALGISGHVPWYADTTREPLRDETWQAWLEVGAVERDPNAQTTSPKGQWWLNPDFAALFDAGLTGQALDEAITAWQDVHLPVEARTARIIELALSQDSTGVEVEINGAKRTLAPGGTSIILKGVIEQLLGRLLSQPYVLTVSESRQKVSWRDDAMLDALGFKIESDKLLPDALVFDRDPANRQLAFVEVVFSDGPITEQRRRAMVDWAEEHGFKSENLMFISAFTSRTDTVFRKAFPTLAWGSIAWCLAAPDQIIRLDQLPGAGS